MQVTKLLEEVDAPSQTTMFRGVELPDAFSHGTIEFFDIEGSGTVAVVARDSGNLAYFDELNQLTITPLPSTERLLVHGEELDLTKPASRAFLMGMDERLQHLQETGRFIEPDLQEIQDLLAKKSA